MTDQTTSADISLRAVPTINVSDVDASIEYYRDKLGFNVSWEIPDESGDGRVRMAGMDRGGAEIFIARQWTEESNFGLHWMVEIGPTDRLNELYEELLQRGANIKMPPTMQSWGWTMLSVLDLDGNAIDFLGDEKKS